MRPLTLERPKPMLEVSGKPLLHHIWKSLPSVIKEVVLVVGYKGEIIKSYFGDEYLGKKITYVFQENKTGTADALNLCRPYLDDHKRFLLLYADDLHSKKSIEKCLDYDRSILVASVVNPKKFGVVIINENNRIIEIEEKPENPKTNLVVTGVYVLDNNIFNYQATPSSSGEKYLTTMIDQLIKDHEVYAEETIFWHPVGYPEDLKSAEKILSEKQEE